MQCFVLFVSRLLACVFCKARASWQWYNFVEHHFKHVIRINMDETSIPVHQGSGKGTVFAFGAPQRASLAKRRQMLSLIAFVCDDSGLQDMMPRVIVCNERTISKTVAASVRKTLPKRLQLIRKQSAWNDSATLAGIVRDLGHRLQKFQPRVPVLLMDACRIHMHPQVLRACADVGIMVVLVPPQSTSLLQPLDVDAYGFNMFKACLRREWIAVRVRGAVDVPFSEFMKCIARAMHDSFDKRTWADVFDRVGYGLLQKAVSSSLLQQLDSDGIEGVGCERPALNVLLKCFPKRSRVLERVLWKRVDGGVVAPSPKSASARKPDCLQHLILPDGSKRCHAQSILQDGAKKLRRK